MKFKDAEFNAYILIWVDFKYWTVLKNDFKT